MDRVRARFSCCLIGLALALAQPLIPAAAAANQTAPTDAVGLRQQTTGQSSAAKLRQLASTPDRLVLELTVPAYYMAEVELDGQRYVTLTVDSLDIAATPRQPRLPRKSVLFGVPPGERWSVRVIEADSQIISLPYPVEPAPVPVAPSIGREAPQVLASGSTLDELTYRTDAFYPAALAATGDSAVLRDLSVVALSLNPFRVNPVRRELEHIRRLVVEVRFENGEVAATKGPADPDAWDAILAGSVVNYDVARSWRGVRSAALQATTTNPPASQSGSFKAEIIADGIYELTAGALNSAGFPVSTANPDNLHVWLDGQELATWVEGQGAGNLERLVFYGQAARGRYTRTNVYWLTHDATPGLRMGERDVAPDGGYPQAATHRAMVHYEENLLYDSRFPKPDGDHWYWTELDFLHVACPAVAAQEYTFDLPHLSATAHTATVGMSIQGTTFGTHHLAAYVNGHAIGDLSWMELNRLEEELTFTSGWLTAGPNTLRLESGDCGPSSDSNGTFNFFEVSYQAEHVADGNLLVFQGEAGDRRYELEGFTSPQDRLLFDITNSLAPERLAGGQIQAGAFVFEDSAATPRGYFAVADDTLLSPGAIYADTPSDLSSPSNEANYLLIGYGPFLGAAQPLVDLRTAQGLQAMSIDVQDVYDEYGFGRLAPEAIRSFLADAHANWTLPPTYVVLLGDGTVDYLDHVGDGWHNYLPAYLVPVEPEFGGLVFNETASDNRLACTAGDDVLPDLFIGRLPATSVAETTAMVAKLVGYEDSPAPGRWNRDVLFVADDEDVGGNFGAKSDELYGRYAWAPLTPHRVYLHDAPTEPHEYDAGVPAEVVAAQAAVQARFNAGQLLVSYFGHSSTSQWAVEILLHRDQVPDLLNGGRLPVVLGMTCYTASFQSHWYAPLDERLVVEPTGGAVAAWGPTGNGYTEGHSYLARGFLDTVMGEGPDKTLGLATSAGKAELFGQDDFFHFMIDSYVLLGDPATTLNLELAEAAHRIHLPIMVRSD